MTTFISTDPGGSTATDAQLRTLIRAYFGVIEGMGLVQTADTGQMTEAAIDAAVRVASGVYGYRMYRFNDALQSSRPIFLRVEFRSAGQTAPVVWLQAGTATNGAGTLTGLTSTNLQVGESGVPGTNAIWYGCHASGFAGVAQRRSFGSTPLGGFILCRTCNSDGVPTGEGFTFVRARNSTAQGAQVTGFRTDTSPAVIFEGVFSIGSYSLNPYALGTTVGGELPAYLLWHATPRISPMFGACAVLSNVMTPGDTFEVALVGNAPRTYINPGPNGIAGENNATTATVAYHAILWE